jgi:transcriptional regulator with XRE-family HTH domain
MEQPGERLKVARRRLKLTYRDVEQASLTIAKRRRNDEFVVALSRLADIENKGTVPTIYRIYTLCAVYRLDFDEVLGWYGVPRKELAFESSQVEIAETHALNFVPETLANVPLSLDSEIDTSKTTFLSQILRRWGILPFNILQGIDLKGHRYGWIGSEDWSMYPIVPPGSLVVIDDTRRKVASGGWTNEFDRPIYFLEHREGYICGWCMLNGSQLLVQPHPSSHRMPVSFAFPGGIEVVGQVTGIAMPLSFRKPRPARAATAE